MPLVTVKWFARPKEMRAEVAKGITEALVKIVGVDPKVVNIIFEEIPRDCLSQGGILASDRK